MFLSPGKLKQTVEDQTKGKGKGKFVTDLCRNIEWFMWNIGIFNLNLCTCTSFVEPQAADDPVKSAQQEIQDLEEILPDIRSKVRIPPKCLGCVELIVIWQRNLDVTCTNYFSLNRLKTWKRKRKILMNWNQLLKKPWQQ